jgi:hypothetical protein
MKRARDLDIHNEPTPIRTDAEVTIHVPEGMEVSMAGATRSGPVALGPYVVASAGPNAAGAVIVKGVTATTDEGTTIELPVSQRAIHHFSTWPGPETVERLCADYLANVEAMLREGWERGFLTIAGAKP